MKVKKHFLWLTENERNLNDNCCFVICHWSISKGMSSVISLSERSLSRFFLFPIFLIDEIDLGQVYRVHDPKSQIKTV